MYMAWHLELNSTQIERIQLLIDNLNALMNHHIRQIHLVCLVSHDAQMIRC